MRLFNILILLFVLSAFAIGVSLSEGDRSIVDSAVNNVSLSIENLTLISPSESKIPNIEGFFLVLEKHIKFIGAFALETLRAGIYFGQDNPEYFEPSFIMGIVKLIIWLVIIGLLIKPIGYVVIFMIMLAIYIKDRFKVRKENKEKANKPSRRRNQDLNSTEVIKNE